MGKTRGGEPRAHKNKKAYKAHVRAMLNTLHSNNAAGKWVTVGVGDRERSWTERTHGGPSGKVHPPGGFSRGRRAYFPTCMMIGCCTVVRESFCRRHKKEGVLFLVERISAKRLLNAVVAKARRELAGS